MNKSIAMLLSMVLLLSVVFTPVSYASTDTVSSRRLFPAEFSSEKAAGILTDEESARVKALVASGKVKDLDVLLAPYFNNCIREETYVETTPRSVAVGTTRYKRVLDNSGIFTYQRKYGIWKSIASATISTVLGKAKKVGDILSYTYSVIGGYEPDIEMEAEAKTQYSYRYIEDHGQVYCYDNYEYTYDYRTRAMAVSREKYEHEYGYYINSQALAKQYTRDYPGSIETLNAPHKGNSTWLKDTAYNRWYYDLPSHYEDWND